MPNSDSNFFSKELIQKRIIPILINEKSSNPIIQVKDNLFSLNRIELQIKDDQTQYRKLIESMRIIEKLTFSIKNDVVNHNNAYPIINASIKDNNTNKNILI